MSPRPARPGAREFGPAYDARRDERRLHTQLETIRNVMLSAGECGTWLTLREVAALTGYGEASISAQLRHLRKPHYGAYRLEKRRRGRATQGLWEYRVGRPVRAEFAAGQSALFP